jgi:hypothetical protein
MPDLESPENKNNRELSVKSTPKYDFSNILIELVLR